MVQDGMCMPRGKTADSSHLQSKKHKQVQEIMAGCNHMCGTSKERKFAEGLKLPRGKPLTKQEVYKYWGSAIEDFPRMLQNRAEQAGTITFNTASGKNKTHLVPSKFLKVGQLYMVPYSTSLGKYMNYKSPNGQILRPAAFSCLPDGHAGSMAEDIFGDLARISEVGDDHHEQFFDESDMTWWPVVSWVPTELIGQEWAWLFAATGVARVTCIMQALEDEIVVWQLFQAILDHETVYGVFLNAPRLAFSHR